MFEDKKFQNIDPKELRISTQPLGEGGFGAVFKAVLLTVTSKLHSRMLCCMSNSSNSKRLA